MKKLGKLVLAASLMAGALFFAPPKASAVDWCGVCGADPTNCVACCRCDGHTLNYCNTHC